MADTFPSSTSHIIFKRPAIVLMFSGGLDSLTALWRLLTDPAFAEYEIHAHHIHFMNTENRASAEREAVSKIYDYLRTNVAKPFSNSESVVGVPALGFQNLFDNDVSKFVGGWFAAQELVAHVAYGVTSDDDQEFSIQDRITRGSAIFGLFSNREKLAYPVRHMSKRECWDALPPDLRTLAWSCRTPKYDAAGKAFMCNDCKACRAMGKILKETRSSPTPFQIR